MKERENKRINKFALRNMQKYTIIWILLDDILINFDSFLFN